jgi:dipeptidyl aminopeptidase/acylaminoacyl peptidase
MRIAALSGLFVLAAFSAEAQQPPVEAFARLPAMTQPTLSPDGARLAYVANDQQASALYILDIDTGDRRGIGVDQIRPQELIWAGNDHLLLIASQADRLTRFGRRNPVDRSAVFSVDVSDPSNVTQLLHDDRQIHPQSLSLGNVVGVDHSSGDVLIPAYEAPRQSGVNSYRMGDAQQAPRNTLWRVDADGSSVRREMQGLPDVYNWFVDSTGNPIGREAYDPDRDDYRFQAYRNGEWATLVQTNTAVLYSEVVGFLSPDEAAFERYYGDRLTLMPLDVNSGEFSTDVVSVPGRDFLGTIRNPYTQLITGIAYDDDGTRVAWFDDELQSLQAALANALGDDSAIIMSWSQDRNRFIVRTDNGEAAPVFYLYDNAARNLSPLASDYPELETVTLGTRTFREFTARDGTTIPGYLTLPPGGGTGLPAVLLPHGGPERQDTGGFDYWAHFLASRGYAVIQPNFRGSSGYGMAHRDAGRGTWGTGIIQTDLYDAVDELAREGVIDADNVCIVGASYGGYAALAAGAFEPGRFDCIAAYAPVANVGLFLGDRELAYGGDSWVANYWRLVFGGEPNAVQRQQLDAISPFYNARSFTDPVLLMHGRDDSSVPISQSRRMADALEDAGKDVTYVEMRGADHWLTNRATRLDVLTRLESFLAEHLGD